MEFNKLFFAFLPFCDVLRKKKHNKTLSRPIFTTVFYSVWCFLMVMQECPQLHWPKQRNNTFLSSPFINQTWKKRKTSFFYGKSRRNAQWPWFEAQQPCFIRNNSFCSFVACYKWWIAYMVHSFWFYLLEARAHKMKMYFSCAFFANVLSSSAHLVAYKQL